MWNWLTMSGTQVYKLCVLVLFIYSVVADWQILNESTDPVTQDLSLRDDNLLPVPAQPGLSRERGLTAAHGQTSSKNASHVTARDLRLQPNQTAAPAGTGRVESPMGAGLTLSALQDSVSRSSPAETTVDAKRDDLIDLAGEGLLLVDKHIGQPSQGHQPSQSRDVAKMPREVTGPADSPAVLGDDRRADSATDLSLSAACIEDSSWECQMFKQHFLAMRADQKLSPRASVYERSKRQASSNYNNAVVVEAGSWNSRNLLDCEDGDCFSGNGNEPDEQEVAPVFRFQASTKTATNLNGTTLTPDVKKTLAKELEDKLTTIFKNIPGFKCVDVDPRYVYIDSNGTLRFDQWQVSIDGGNTRYTGANGTAVAGLVKAAITDASEQYSNVTVRGQHPIDYFNISKAVDEVEKEADNPCKMDPSPCCRGFGQCTLLNNTEKHNGIRLRCTRNCLTHHSCGSHGLCSTDSAGNAYCNCTASWMGPSCDKENQTTSNRDDIRSPVFIISQTSQIPTSLKNEDLTPEKRRELAQELIDSLKITFGNFSGFRDIKLNPDNIRIDKGGVLVIPWNLTFDTGNPAYSGKNATEIADAIRTRLQELGDSYRNNVTVDGQHPIDDLDFVGAAQQVEKQAGDPCSSGSCQLGYDICQALSATSIKCIHNCNSRPTDCQHGGQCQLDSAGHAVCQCSGDYTGADCESEDSSLDGGQIAGIVAGSALIVGAMAGTVCMMMMCARRRNKDVNFTEYSDEPSSDLASNPSHQLFAIDRPAVYMAPMSIYGQPPRPNFSTPSSYAASNNSGAGNSPADEFNSRA